MLVCGNPLKVIGWTFLNSFSLMWMGVKFWEDEWCKDYSLKVAFPELYSTSRNKEALALKVMQFSDGWLHCDIRFHCQSARLGRNIGQFFWDVLYYTNVQGVGADRLC